MKVALLGVGSFLPQVYMVHYYLSDIAQARVRAPWEFENPYQWLHLSVIVLAFATFFFYAQRVDKLGPRARRAMIVLLLGNVLVLPAYWYYFTWRQRVDRGDER